MPLTAQEQAELDQLNTASSQATGLNGLLFGPKGYSKPTPEEAEYAIKQNLREIPKQSEDAVKAMAASFFPEGTANPVGWLARKLGLDKIPGALMNRAVGLRGQSAEIGQKLIDEGVVGTKDAMNKQVGSKIQSHADALGQAVKDIPEFIDSKGVASEVSDVGKRYVTPGGVVPKEVAPEMNKVVSTATDIANRGTIPATEALAFKRIAGGVGYDATKPLSGLSAELAQKESGAYGKALEDAYSNAHPNVEAPLPGQPTVPNKVKDENAALTALLRAKKGLSAPETGNPTLGMTTDVGAAGAGLALGHPGLGIATVLGRHAAKSPLVQSVAAQGTSKLLSPAVSQAPFTALMRKGAKARIGSGLTEDEQKELDDLNSVATLR